MRFRFHSFRLGENFLHTISQSTLTVVAIRRFAMCFIWNVYQIGCRSSSMGYTAQYLLQDALRTSFNLTCFPLTYTYLVGVYLEYRLWTSFVFHQIRHTSSIPQDICAKSNDEHAYVRFHLCDHWDSFCILFDHYCFQCFSLSTVRKILECVHRRWLLQHRCFVESHGII